MFEAQLREVPFFSGLSKQDLAMVAQNTDEIEVPAGRVLAREGDHGQEFFVILDGTAEVLRDGTPIAKLGPGEFFGEMALLDEERRVATVKALSGMRVLVMTSQSFRELDRSMPQIHAAVREAICARRTAQPASAGPGR